ncbi:hypothetical protein VTK73DRAFT_3820 [Phialemonium thermophilum]|uniref:Uncharacterized protein n=1 Tax=Phialemonium thermophilum TaxID=223376 RepID=A0ABR3VEB2_9PEZI
MGDPLRARVAVLDTMVERFQMDPRIAERIYSAQGNPIPALADHPSFTLSALRLQTPTERWYKKQGYVEFYTDKSGYLWTDPATGEKVPVAIVFLKKYLQ